MSEVSHTPEKITYICNIYKILFGAQNYLTWSNEWEQISLVKQFITELKGRALYKNIPNNVSCCLAQVQFLTITATMNIFTYLMTLESEAWNWENYFACPVGVSGLSSYSSVNKEHLSFSWYMNNDLLQGSPSAKLNGVCWVKW